MNAPRRKCPGCRSTLQVFFVGDLEIDRCLFCGGLWFDRGELSDAATKDLFLESTDALSPRRCPDCGQALARGRVGAIDVESCGSCGGTYLDEGELATLAEREVPLEPARPDRQVSFRCMGCAETFLVEAGFSDASGYVCRACFAGDRRGHDGLGQPLHPLTHTSPERMGALAGSAAPEAAPGTTSERPGRAVDPSADAGLLGRLAATLFD